jgi:chemotaxis signal transduction protein
MRALIFELNGTVCATDAAAVGEIAAYRPERGGEPAPSGEHGRGGERSDGLAPSGEPRCGNEPGGGLAPCSGLAPSGEHWRGGEPGGRSETGGGSGLGGVGPCGEFIVGARDYRGGRIPIVDLNRRFGFGATEPTVQSKIIIADVGGVKLGFAVNRVVDIAVVSGDALRPVPACAATEGNRGYLSGVLLSGERPAVLIDMGGILGEAELRACCGLQRQRSPAVQQDCAAVRQE